MNSMKSLALVTSALLFPLLAETALPNIILMMGDDHGWEETGSNGHPHVQTPVLDEMSTTGLKFERFYEMDPPFSRKGGPLQVFKGESSEVLFRENRGTTSIELFNLKADPAEKSNLIDQQPDLASKLQTDLRNWQDSVLMSLTGADYHAEK
jgi:hypothetical protein